MHSHNGQRNERNADEKHYRGGKARGATTQKNVTRVSIE